VLTSLYAALLGFLFFKISIDTITARRRNKLSLGIGENKEIASIVAAHSNFSSYVPIFLILFYLLESSGNLNVFVLHTVGVTFFLGRLFHFLAFRAKKMDFKLRVLGMHMTLWPIVALSIGNLLVFILPLLLEILNLS